MRRALLPALLLGLAGGPAAQAQQQPPLYRADQPAVLEREPGAQTERARAEALSARFVQAYQKAGSPRILLLWHRSVSDQFADEQQQLTRTSVSVGALARDNHAQQVVISWKGQPPQPASLLAPARAADYETGLLQPLLAAGVRLVDRNMAIRMTALKANGAASAPGAVSGASLEAPMIEAQAFAELADQVLQVQLLPDAQSGTGWRARLTLIEVRSGALVADSLRAIAAPRDGGVVARVNERPPAEGERVWQATEKGFVAQQRPVSLGQIGQRDALALMELLAAR